MPDPTQAFNLLDIIGRVFTIWTLIQLVVWVVGALIGTWLFTTLFLKKERRLIKNLQKPIAIVNLTGDPALVETEVEQIERNSLFKSPDVWHDARSVNFLSNHCAVVIAITDTTVVADFTTVYQKAIELRKPVIIYTAGNRKTNFINDNGTLIYSYPFHSIATTPLRLMGDIFGTLSTFPN